MTYFTNWDEFAKAVERLYSSNPANCRFITKFSHRGKKLVIKMTDDIVCLQFRTDQVQDVRRMEKLSATLMRTIVSAGASS